MRQRIAAGIGAGLVAGLVFAVVMRALPVVAADGSEVSLITFAARLVSAGSPMVGWLAYVAYAVVLGGLFGASFPVRRLSLTRTGILGGVWGTGWCAVALFGLIPTLLGHQPFSPTALEELRRLGVPLLIGHVAYGVVLGACFRLILDAFPTAGGAGRAESGVRRAA